MNKYVQKKHHRLSSLQFFVPELLNLKIEKQPPEVFCKKRCSYKVRKIIWETAVPESRF